MKMDEDKNNVSQEEFDKVEQEIKQKEEQKQKEIKDKTEKDLRASIAKEQELVDLKKKLADIEAEKTKSEQLVLDQKKQYEEEVTDLKSQIGSSKAIRQLDSNSQERTPTFNTAAMTKENIIQINEESRQQWEAFLEKQTKKQ